MLTIPQQFFETAQRYGRRPALRSYLHGRWHTLTYGQIQQQVLDMAGGLRTLGIKPGDRIGLLSENRPGWFIADMAIMTLGAIVVPLHTTLSPKLLHHVVADAGLSVIIISNQALYHRLMEAMALSSAPTIEIVITLDAITPDPSLSCRLISLAEVMNHESKTFVELDASQLEQSATIVYTSGTTDAPRGVVLTHQAIMSNVIAAQQAVPVTSDDTFLSVLPLSHMLERNAGWYVPLLVSGACVAVVDGPKQIKRALITVRPTVMIVVPRLVEKLADSVWAEVNKRGALARRLFHWILQQRKYSWSWHLGDKIIGRRIRASFGGRLRFMLSGGAAMNPKIAKFFDRLGLAVTEGYGLTEAAPVVSVNRLSAIRFGSVGQALSGVTIQLSSDKEILVRGPNVMTGYYNNPTATAAILDADDWLHTGDMGFVDADGYLTVIGRKKEMITLSNGKNVWPEQLELQLTVDRYIAQACVFGSGRSYITALIVPAWQEIIDTAAEHGITVADPDALVDDPAVRALLQQRIDRINHELADWEQVRGFAILRHPFSQADDELTPTLKLRRGTIAGRHAAAIAGVQ